MSKDEELNKITDNVMKVGRPQGMKGVAGQKVQPIPLGKDKQGRSIPPQHAVSADDKCIDGKLHHFLFMDSRFEVDVDGDDTTWFRWDAFHCVKCLMQKETKWVHNSPTRPHWFPWQQVHPSDHNALEEHKKS